MSQNLRFEFCSVPVGFYALSQWISGPVEFSIPKVSLNETLFILWSLSSMIVWESRYPLETEHSNERFTMTVDVFTRGPKGWDLSKIVRTTLPETNSLHLKIRFPKTHFIFQPSIFRGELFVSGKFNSWDSSKQPFLSFLATLVLLHQFGCPRSVSFTWLTLGELHTLGGLGRETHPPEKVHQLVTS